MGFFDSIGKALGDIWKGVQSVFTEVISWLIPIPSVPDFDKNLAEQNAQGVLINKQSNNASIPIVYGERLVGGTRVFLSVEGTTNEYLYGAIVLCEGEINAITEVRVDDDVVTFSGGFADGTQITSNDARFGTTITIQPFYGTDGQSASSLLSTLDDWGTNHKLSGVSYIAFRITWDADKYTGIPNIQAKVQGKKVVSYVASNPNPAENLTLSNTYQSITSLVSIPNRNQDVVFQSDSNGILLKSSYTDAEIWWDIGGNQVGAWSGIAKINNDYFIRFRTGSGSSSYQTTGGGTAGGNNSRAIVNLSVSDSSVASYFDDERHIITWAIEVPDATYLAGRLRLWIDGNEVITYEPYNDNGNVLRSGQWAGSDLSGYGQGYGDIAGDDGTFDSGATRFQSFTGSSVGSDVYLYAYENQKITSIPSVSYTSQSPAYSSNPAWCLLDYLTNTRYGKGINISNIDIPSFYTASTVCSTQITPYSGGADIDLINCNAVIDTSNKIIDNVRNLLVGMRGLITYQQGKFRLVVESTGSSVLTLNSDNIIGGISVQSEKKNTKFNRMQVNFINPEKNYQSDLIVYDTDHATYLAEDDNFLQEGALDVPTITSPYQAREMGRIVLLRSRNSLQVSLTANYEALSLSVGDIVSLTDAITGFSAKSFRVAGLGINADYTVSLSLTEHQNSWYTYQTQTQVADEPDTSFPNPFTVQPPSSITLDDELIQYNDGTVIVAMNITIGASPDQFVREYQVEYKRTDDSNFIVHSRGTVDLFHRVLNVISGDNYTVRVKAINSLGVESTSVTATRDIVGEIEPPSDVQDFAINIVGSDAHLSWESIPDADLNYYVINFTTETVNPEWQNSFTLVSRVSRPATSITVPARTGSYLIKAVDKLGNFSSNEAIITTNIISIGDFQNAGIATEHPNFTGVKNNTVAVDNTLILDTIEQFDDNTTDNFDDITARNFDGGTINDNVVSSGTYEFANLIDLGSIQTARLTGNITQTATDRDRLFDNILGLFDDQASNFDGDDSANASSHLEIAVSNDNVTYTSFRNFNVGDYSGRYFKFRLFMESLNNSATPIVSQLSVTADMPQRLISENDVVSGAGTKSITFSPVFISTPAIGVSAQGLATGDFYEITSKSTNGFDITFKNSGGTAISKTFDYIAKGY
jgi:hypothetical protein